MHRVSTFTFVAVLFLLAPILVYSQPPSEDPSTEILDRLRLLEDRVKKIETMDGEIATRDQKILNDLSTIRVQVHHRSAKTKTS